MKTKERKTKMIRKPFFFLPIACCKNFNKMLFNQYANAGNRFRKETSLRRQKRRIYLRKNNDEYIVQ